MEEYSFYVYHIGDCKKNLTLSKAIEEYKKTKMDKYKALGVNKGVHCCDLLNNLGKNIVNRISSDYEYSSFKNDQYITLKVINILKKEFNL